MVAHDLESARQQSRDAVAAIFRGDSQSAKALFSDRDDVTLGNPFGPFARGRQQLEEALERAASNYRDGEVTDVELVATYVSGDLACVVEVERGSRDRPRINFACSRRCALRVASATSIPPISRRRRRYCVSLRRWKRGVEGGCGNRRCARQNGGRTERKLLLLAGRECFGWLALIFLEIARCIA
jgi:hypothetical protein